MKKKIIIILISVVGSIIMICGLTFGGLMYYYLGRIRIKIEYESERIYIKTNEILGQDMPYYVYYQSISNLELKDTIYTTEDGDDDGELGHYKNEIYGFYFSYLEKDADLSVVVTINDDYVMVIGLKSEKKTKELYERLLNEYEEKENEKNN